MKEEIIIKWIAAWDKVEYPDNDLHEVMQMAIYDAENEDNSNVKDIPNKREYLEACQTIRLLHDQIKVMKQRLEFISWN